MKKKMLIPFHITQFASLKRPKWLSSLILSSPFVGLSPIQRKCETSNKLLACVPGASSFGISVLPDLLIGQFVCAEIFLNTT